MVKRFRRRRTDKRNGSAFVIVLQRYAQLLVTGALAVGVIVAAINHFATAADVEQKFLAVKRQITVATVTARKQIVEDKLYDLRSLSRQNSATRAAIEKYDAELRDLNARLRDLEREKHDSK